MTNQQAIGFFDSGVGGLTVVKEALRQLPNEKIIYIGDTARCPYGPRPGAQVKEFSWQLTQFLLKKKIKMLVIACNTATAVSLEEIRQKIAIPVIGVILPGSRAALRNTRNNRIGVIGTTGTVQSHVYRNALLQKSPETIVTSLACPKLVSIVESNEATSPVAKMIVAESLRPLRYTQMDTLILGCTHYPILRPIIQNVVGSKVRLIDSGVETVSEVSTLLDYFEIAAEPTLNPPQPEFYTTGSPLLFKELAQKWLQRENLAVSKVVL